LPTDPQGVRLSEKGDKMSSINETKPGLDPAGVPLNPSEEELKERFSPARIGELAQEFLAEGTEHDLGQLALKRQFVVAYIDANGKYSDIPRSVEALVFSKTFEEPLTKVVKDYGKYDPMSKFATVIDVSTSPYPTAAGALRITEYDPDLGFKDVNDLVADDPENPWIEEIKAEYFDPDEEYSPAEAWKRIGIRAQDTDLLLSESLDIASHASAEGYSGVRGAINGVSMLFYHACLRYAVAKDWKNLVAIFDIPPLENLQQFNKPFDLHEGLNPHPYGGPYDTIPAYCVIENAIKRFRQAGEPISSTFVNGVNLDKVALLPNEYQPEEFSDEAVGLSRE